VSHNRFPNGCCTGAQFRENLSIYFFFIFRDLPQQKIPRELCSGEDLAIFLCSHVPMERFFDGTDPENSETQGGKGHIRIVF